MKVARPLRSSVVESTRNSKPRNLSYGSEFVAGLLPWPRELPDGDCKGHYNADVFSSPFTHEDLDEAVQVCASCPIAADCFSIGVNRQETGVYGGVYLNRGNYSTHSKYALLPKYRKR